MLVFFLSVELFFQTSLHGQPPSSSRPDNRLPSDTAQTRAPLLDVLIALNKTKGVYFLFSQPSLGKVLVNTPPLSSNLPIEKILGQVLKNTGLHFKKVDEHTFVIPIKIRTMIPMPEYRTLPRQQLTTVPPLQ
jgi:hypothetical protein